MDQAVKTAIDGLRDDLADLDRDVDVTLQNALESQKQLQAAISAAQEHVAELERVGESDKTTIDNLKAELAAAATAASQTDAVDALNSLRSTVANVDAKLAQAPDAATPPAETPPAPTEAPEGGSVDTEAAPEPVDGSEAPDVSAGQTDGTETPS